MEREYKGKFVIVMLCSQCNNKCDHCYINYTGRFTEDELNTLIPKLNEKYKVILNGTEPILFPEYYKFFKMTGTNSILTNGIRLLNDDNTMNLLKENDIMSISLSYHFGMQNNISQMKTMDLEKLIRKLKSNKFKVRLLCTLFTDNYKNIEDYCYNAIQLGVDGIKFTNFIYQGNGIRNFETAKLLNNQQIDEVLLKIDLLRKKITKDKLYIERCGTFGPNLCKNNFECLAGNNIAVITPDRKVYDCVFDIGENNSVGILDDEYNIMINDNSNCNTGKCKVLCKYNKINRMMKE